MGTGFQQLAKKLQDDSIGNMLGKGAEQMLVVYGVENSPRYPDAWHKDKRAGRDHLDRPI
jgi:hypothetical protein